MTIVVKYYTPCEKGQCLGIVNIFLPQWDLYLNGIRHMNGKGGGHFYAWPSKPYEKDGETKYAPYFLFGKDMNKRFQEALDKAVKDHLSQGGQEQDSSESLPF